MEIPLVLIVYNRPLHTERTLAALMANYDAERHPLYVYSDGPKNAGDVDRVRRVRSVLSKADGFKSIDIIEREQNRGLCGNLKPAVDDIMDKHGRAIVLEDDIVTGRCFLRYMSEMLRRYYREENVFSISGYNYPRRLMKVPRGYKYDIFFAPRPSCWGWASWSDRWNRVEWTEDVLRERFDELADRLGTIGDDLPRMLYHRLIGRNDSWAIMWIVASISCNSVSVYPISSYVENIGNDGSGVHCKATRTFDQAVDAEMEIPYSIPPAVFADPEIIRRFQRVHDQGIVGKLWRFVVGRGLGVVRGR